MPHALNPFRTLPNPREVWAWGMYDLANQSFQLLINTLLFVIYVKNTLAPTPDAGVRWFGGMAAAGLLIITIVSPVVGAIADRRAWKMEMLIATGLVCAGATALLALLQPGMLWTAALLYVIAAVACGLGENFLGAFLPQIATPKTMGRVSALGWTMSYVGAIFLLGIVALVVFVFRVTEPEQWRWLFVFAGAWFLGGMVPAMLFLREKAAPIPAPLSSAVRGAREAVWGRGRFKHLRRFFIAFFVYSLGTNTVIYFLGSIGDDLGFGIGRLVLLGLVMAIAAGGGAILCGAYQDRLGHRFTVMSFIAVWAVSTIGMAVAQGSGIVGGGGRDWMFWPIAAGLGIGLGGVGTASRALVGLFTPAHRSGEFFGVYGTLGKLSGVVALLLYAGASTTIGKTPALLMLAGFFLAGFLLMLTVDARAGESAARDAEHKAGGRRA